MLEDGKVPGREAGIRAGCCCPLPGPDGRKPLGPRCAPREDVLATPLTVVMGTGSCETLTHRKAPLPVPGSKEEKNSVFPL